MKRVPCLVAECRKVARCRGLCVAHYHAARRVILAGRTTWGALEQLAAVLPPAKPGRPRGEGFAYFQRKIRTALRAPIRPPNRETA